MFARRILAARRLPSGGTWSHFTYGWVASLALCVFPSSRKTGRSWTVAFPLRHSWNSSFDRCAWPTTIVFHSGNGSSAFGVSPSAMFRLNKIRLSYMRVLVGCCCCYCCRCVWHFEVLATSARCQLLVSVVFIWFPISCLLFEAHSSRHTDGWSNNILQITDC